MNLSAIVLAQGDDREMQSERTRLVHDICGKAMIAWLNEHLLEAGFLEQLYVVGRGQETIRDTLGEDQIYVLMEEEEENRVALMQVASFLEGRSGCTLLVPADAPLLRVSTLSMAMKQFHEQEAKALVLTAETRQNIEAPLIRSDRDGLIQELGESQAWKGQVRMREIATGFYLFDTAYLLSTLGRLSSEKGAFGLDGAQIVQYLLDEGQAVYSFGIPTSDALRVRNRVELERARQRMNRRICEWHMMSGVSIENPDSCLIEAGVRIDRDVFIGSDCRLTGSTMIESGTVLGPRVHLHQTLVGRSCRLDAGYYLNCVLADEVMVGPHAHFSNEVQVGRQACIGAGVSLSDCRIGANCTLGNRVSLTAVTLEEFVTLGNGVMVLNELPQETEEGTRAIEHSVVESHAQIGDLSRLYAPFSILARTRVQPGSIVQMAKKSRLPWSSKPRKASKILEEEKQDLLEL